MKKLLLIICVVLAVNSLQAQNEARISGRVINSTHDSISLVIYNGRDAPVRASIREIPLNKDGTFNFKIVKIEKPFRASLMPHRMNGMLPLVFAEGYDLHLTLDVASAPRMWETVNITGKGSDANSYWKKLYTYRISHKDTINWYVRNEEAYLRHFRDSVNAITTMINAIGEKENDPNRNFYKERFLKDQNIRSAKSLYRYSFVHQYTYEQTQSFLKKAGLPGARDYLNNFESGNGVDPLIWVIRPRKADSLIRKEISLVSSLEKDGYLSRSKIIYLRIEPIKRADAASNPDFGPPVIERSAEKTTGDGYIGDIGREFNPDGSQHLYTYIIDGKNYVELAGYRINRTNAGEFQYRIIQNGVNELVSWKKPSEFRTTRDGKVSYAYFGKFNYKEGQVITLEVRNIKNSAQKDAVTIDWRSIQKPVIDFAMNYVRKYYNYSLNALPERTISLQQSLVDEFGPSAPPFIISAAPDIRFRLGDSLQSLSFTLKNNPETYSYYISLKQKIDTVTRIINLGKTNTRAIVDKWFWSVPGEYEITFTPRLYSIWNRPYKDLNDKAETIKFTVLPALDPPAVYSVRQLVQILAAFVLCAALIFYLFRRRQQQRISHEQRQKELATLQLRSVRSQLNPHFMFNALAGIQNLMNRNEPDAANLYLSKFARLTRNVLDENEKDLVTISSEIALLEDYLEMEKMRFGFKYVFETDPAIDKENTEIPSMLLQPFVENAVKHGVAGMDKNGLITIRFRKQEKDLILQVHDNGSGAKINDAGNGKGIKLTENRIDLYNRLYKDTAISLNINQDEDGTLVALELKDWI